MIRQYIQWYIAIIFGVMAHGAFGQNLEKIGDKKPLKISGGVSANQIGYLSSAADVYRDPYTWVITGNLNIELWEWAVPLSYTLSNYGRNFQQPFNQYSMHPKYKWINVHLGYCSMSFSPYTLSGHTFLGVGADLTPPGKFYTSFFFGRLRKALQPDTLTPGVQPQYRRMGWGIKAGVNLQANNIEMIIFKAQDDPHSIDGYVITDSVLRPRENLILSFKVKTQLLKKLTWNFETAGSCYTSDVNQPVVTGQKNIYALTQLIQIRSATAITHAYKSGLSYSFGSSSVGIGYERVDPGYQTLGAYYTNNDFENYTVNVATSLFQNKMSLSGSTGIQYDDLDNKKGTRTSRYVNAINASFAPSQKISVSGSYSNFSSYTNIKSPFRDINQSFPITNPDTLNYTQISQSVGGNVSFSPASDEKRRQSVIANFNYMITEDKQTGTNNKTHIYTAFLAYNYTMVPQNLTLTSSVTYNLSQYPGNNTFTVGPNIGVSKSFLKNTLQSSLRVAYNESYTSHKKTNATMVVQCSGGYKFLKNHQLNLNLTFSKRKVILPEKSNHVYDFTGMLSYAYQF